MTQKATLIQEKMRKEIDQMYDAGEIDADDLTILYRSSLIAIYEIDDKEVQKQTSILEAKLFEAGLYDALPNLTPMFGAD